MKNFIYIIVRLFLQTVGKLSTGIRMSYTYGFTSGKMLEYVYNNRPSGFTIVGKTLDKIYLSHEGWKSVRERMFNLVDILYDTAKNRFKKRVKIIDIAGGTGLYLFELIGKIGKDKVEIVVRDIEKKWVTDGNKKAKNLGLANVIRFKTGDAFSKEDLYSDVRNTDIVIASGFYDWFEDRKLIEKSFKLIYECLPEGKYFIFTIQTKHFNLAFTNAMFVDFHRHKLTMTTTEHNNVLEIIKQSGFKIVDFKADSRVYYTVYRTLK
jgi:ubiquinone/menaquinone biosynthesis C-methylase UbiE